MSLEFSTSADSCAKIAVAITPADSDLVENVRALYIGTGGSVRVTTVLNNDVLFSNVVAGTILPVSVKRVWSTSTTASNIIGLA
jgi:hypothetical protein